MIRKGKSGFGYAAAWLVIVGLLLPACAGHGKDGGTGMETASPTPVEKVTLRFASVYTKDHPFGPVIARLLDEFTIEHPEVTLVKEFMPSTQMEKKLLTDRASDNLPDLFVVYPNASNAEYIKENKILDLSEYFDQDPEWKDGFISGALDHYKYPGYSGIYAAPLGAYGTGFFYNKELFQKANVEPPETWEQLLVVVQKLQKADIRPITIGAVDSWRATHLFTALFYKWNGIGNAGSFGSRKLPYRSAAMIEPMKRMVELVRAGAFGKNDAATDYEAEIAEFNQGKAAMRYSGTWTVGESIGMGVPEGFADKVGFFPFPYFAGKEEYKDFWMGGVSDSFAVSSKVSGHQKDMAIALLKKLTSPESSKLILESAHDLTSVKADVDPLKSGRLIAEVSKAMSTSKGFAGDLGEFEPEQSVKNRFAEMMQEVLTLRLDPESAASQVDKEVRKSDQNR